ncbi:MAG TPA: hypothetical protein VK991_04400, partial [Halomonas sp.]|nr:hypothetical protein [Halomonas sp.]
QRFSRFAELTGQTGVICLDRVTRATRQRWMQRRPRWNLGLPSASRRADKKIKADKKGARRLIYALAVQV